MKGFSYLKGVSTLALDRGICTGCRICTEVCPHNLFYVAGGKAEILDTDLCMECGACALNCPAKAITVDAGVGCASGMINEWLASFNIGKKSRTGCC
ncbi:MAG: 4Fe-4S binding protein [Geobacteraceae bacterium]|nr:4Fe-4S binding protein [Geobacteraceae bacterium]